MKASFARADDVGTVGSLRKIGRAPRRRRDESICTNRSPPRSILQALALLDNKLERNAKLLTRKKVVALLAAWGFYGAAAVAQIIKFRAGHDSFYLYAGIINLAMSALLIIFFAQILRRIPRRDPQDDSAPTSTL